MWYFRVEDGGDLSDLVNVVVGARRAADLLLIYWHFRDNTTISRVFRELAQKRNQ